MNQSRMTALHASQIQSGSDNWLLKVLVWPKLSPMDVKDGPLEKPMNWV